MHCISPGVQKDIGESAHNIYLSRLLCCIWDATISASHSSRLVVRAATRSLPTTPAPHISRQHGIISMSSCHPHELDHIMRLFLLQESFYMLASVALKQ